MIQEDEKVDQMEARMVLSLYYFNVSSKSFQCLYHISCTKQLLMAKVKSPTIEIMAIWTPFHKLAVMDNIVSIY